MNRKTYEDPVTKKTLSYGAAVKKGLAWLIEHQSEDGRFGPEVSELMYGHAMATLALSEAYGITNAAAYKAPTEKGVAFIDKAQNEGLGWRYTPRCGSSDTSITGWCVVALKSAQISGLKFDDKNFLGAKVWLNRVTDKDGTVGYDHLGSGPVVVPGKNDAWKSHPTMTALGMLCRIFIDKKKGDPLLAKGAALLVADLPKWDAKGAHPTVDSYYWYEGTIALFQYDGPKGPNWTKWSKAIFPALVQNQRQAKDGCLAGSWDAGKVDRWGYAGGRVYTTAVDLLTLEIHARYDYVSDAEKKDGGK